MKKLILIFISALMLPSCGEEKPVIIGEWTSKDDYGNVETTIFKEDHSMIVIKNDKVEDFNMEGKTLKYEVDNSKTPRWFSMIIYDDKNQEEVMRVKGIYEFLSDNTFRLCINGGKRDLAVSLQRPSGFDEKNTTIFTRK